LRVIKKKKNADQITKGRCTGAKNRVELFLVCWQVQDLDLVFFFFITLKPRVE